MARDLAAPAAAWYHHSTWRWLIVTGVASLIFLREWRQLWGAGVDIEARFRTLPPQ